MKDDFVPVSSTDELTVAGGLQADRVRTLGEYKATNTPLSAAEIEERTHRRQWIPRTTKTIHEIEPLPGARPA